MTIATGYLGKREFHGPLARHSPYSAPAVMCVVCSVIVRNTTEIADEICINCWLKGWRPPR
jgi:hypothetical protein